VKGKRLEREPEKTHITGTRIGDTRRGWPANLAGKKEKKVVEGIFTWYYYWTCAKKIFWKKSWKVNKERKGRVKTKKEFIDPTHKKTLNIQEREGQAVEDGIIKVERREGHWHAYLTYECDRHGKNCLALKTKERGGGGEVRILKETKTAAGERAFASRETSQCYKVVTTRKRRDWKEEVLGR